MTQLNTPSNNRSLSVGILAIGTELTNGQIANRNAQWLSARLLTMGFQTLFHHTVPDDRTLVVSELQYLENQVDLVLTTGGLGPTSDDFTRDCVTEWLEKKLIWSEPAWNHVESRLKDRGVTVRDFQKQQCFFPEDAELFINERGTAWAFAAKKERPQYSTPVRVAVLPGPPNEIEGVWNDHLKAWLEKEFPNRDPYVVKSWDYFGLGESELAHEIEIRLKDCPFEKAYRVHIPYVEFKLSFKQSEFDSAQKWIDKIDEVRPDKLVSTDSSDVVSRLLAKLPPGTISITDEVTGAALINRLSSWFESRKVQFLCTENNYFLDSKHLYLGLKKINFDQIEVSLKYQGQTRKSHFEAPRFLARIKKRQDQYFCEQALLFWEQCLK